MLMFRYDVRGGSYTPLSTLLLPALTHGSYVGERSADATLAATRELQQQPADRETAFTDWRCMITHAQYIDNVCEGQRSLEETMSLPLAACLRSNLQFRCGIVCSKLRRSFSVCVARDSRVWKHHRCCASIRTRLHHCGVGK